MNITDTSWSLAVLIWIPICIVLTLICVGLIVFSIIKIRNDEDRYDGWKIVAVCCAVIVPLLIGCSLWGFYPYKTEYHQWATTTGVVSEIDSRLLSDGNGSTERYVVTFEGGEQRACDDTRCSAVEVGDTLVLSCKRSWQYTGTDGYDCNYIDSRKSE